MTDASADNDESETTAPQRSLLTKRQLTLHVRQRIAGLIHDSSGCEPKGFAIYSLSDPRAIRDIRYVGQTQTPARRLLQHINTARLWLPDEVPWWFKSPELRPLYDWIRELHRDEYRLPLMVVAEWVPTLAEARAREREHIYEALHAGRSLFNVEHAWLGPQVPLL